VIPFVPLRDDAPPADAAGDRTLPSRPDPPMRFLDGFPQKKPWLSTALHR
jgi:hypothetical protein